MVKLLVWNRCAVTVAVAVLTACGSGTNPSTSSESAVLTDPAGSRVGAKGYVFPSAPPVSEQDLDHATSVAVEQLLGNIQSALNRNALDAVVASGDARLGWVLADLLRFLQIGTDAEALTDAFTALTGVELPDDSDYNPWQAVTDHLIAWDLPAPPGYQAMKRALFVQVEPAWDPFFSDEQANVDWRLVTWGGVFIDNRPLGETGFCPRGCIPALDDPPLTAAPDGDWYPNANIIFGLVVNGEAVALPKNMMEVHEMVNITVGGRRLGIPYCTLCSSAQAYFLDENPSLDQDLVLRTSGLLSRSNKMMYELGTYSLIDTFTGVATSGPLLQVGTTLEQTTVVASRWGDWKEDHPTTHILAEDGGLGRTYPEDPLEGRDAAGPIFPVGDVDPRLPAQTLVIGVISPDGRPIAFPADLARTVIEGGREVVLAKVRLQQEGTGFRAVSEREDDLPAHQAFWFAWSQFHPATLLWEAP